jgi:hypothetical protein
MDAQHSLCEPKRWSRSLGQYKLTSHSANGAHQSYGASMSLSIMVTVKWAA